jgi:2-polyprenyl-3-methyl-5-hydroxy-6-metoxy-1,4-benzoquinol methylase
MTTSRREGDREKPFGYEYRSSPVDRFGQWLSARRVRRAVHGFDGKAIGDFGCGYNADLVRSVLPEVASATLVDLAIAPDLKQVPNVVAIEGTLPEALEQVSSQSLDVVICNNVLEHLWEPQLVLQHIRRVLKQGAIAFVNVPSWRGRFFLETAAFRLHLAPAEEMDDHKRYYSPNELWMLLVEGGFRPMEIVACRSHKFGLNTFAECKVR